MHLILERTQAGVGETDGGWAFAEISVVEKMVHSVYLTVFSRTSFACFALYVVLISSLIFKKKLSPIFLLDSMFNLLSF